MVTDLLGVTEFPWVLAVLEDLVGLEVLEVLEVLVLSFHLFLTNLHSKEVLRHSWVLILTDLRYNRDQSLFPRKHLQ